MEMRGYKSLKSRMAEDIRNKSVKSLEWYQNYARGWSLRAVRDLLADVRRDVAVEQEAEKQKLDEANAAFNQVLLKEMRRGQFTLIARDDKNDAINALIRSLADDTPSGRDTQAFLDAHEAREKRKVEQEAASAEFAQRMAELDARNAELDTQYAALREQYPDLAE